MAVACGCFFSILKSKFNHADYLHVGTWYGILESNSLGLMIFSVSC